MQKKLYFCTQISVFFRFFTKMKDKNFWKQSKLRIILLHVATATLVVVGLLIALIIGLRKSTQHGKEITVPNITSLYVEEAKILTASEGLKIEVIDSTYSQKTPLGTIVEQNPLAGSKVKNGRTIYVIQNANMRKPVILPNLQDLSLRQAESTIQAIGLTLEDIIYEPSTYKNIILEVRHADTTIYAGTRLQEGNAVTLVVGKGQGTKEVSVPNVIGLSLVEALSLLRNASLNIGIIEYDVQPTEDNKTQYIIYSQEPRDGTLIVEGSTVHIKLSLHREKAVTADADEDEEEFF